MLFVILYPIAKLCNSVDRGKIIVEMGVVICFYILSIFSDNCKGLIIDVDDLMTFGILFIIGMIIANHESIYLKLNNRFFMDYIDNDCSA